MIKSSKDLNELIKYLKEYRIINKISQTELADKTGLSQQYVSRIEKLNKNITYDVIRKYAKGLGFDLKRKFYLE